MKLNEMVQINTYHLLDYEKVAHDPLLKAVLVLEGGDDPTLAQRQVPQLIENKLPHKVDCDANGGPKIEEASEKADKCHEKGPETLQLFQIIRQKNFFDFHVVHVDLVRRPSS